MPYGTLASPAKAPYGSRRIWKILKIPVRGPHDARTGHTRGPCGVLWIIQSNHKCTVVSSRTGPLAWCDHENSTSVKFLRALHSALWARNRTGAKNRTGPVVGCDWGIRLNLKQSYTDRSLDSNLFMYWFPQQKTLQWHHNGHDGIWNHQPHHYFLDLLFRRRSKKSSKLRVTGLWVGNSLGTGKFPAQMASNVENDDIIMFTGTIYWLPSGMDKSMA